MRFKIRCILAAVVCCLLTASCRKADSLSSMDSFAETYTKTTSADIVTDTEAPQTSYTRITADGGISFYEINCPSVPAEEALTCIDLNYPETINNQKVDVVDFIDEETLLVYLYSDTTAEAGTISLHGDQIGSYQKLLSLNQNQFPSIGNERWLIITEADEAKRPLDNPPRRYRLFDMQQKELYSPFWEQTANEQGEPIGGGSYNPLLVIGSTVYFDDYSIKDGKMTATMYGYDIESGRITETYPETQKPMLCQGQLIGFTRNDNGDFRRLISVKDQGASFQMECSDNLMLIETGTTGVYALTNEGLDENQLTISRLGNLTTGQTILTANTVLGDLSVSDRLVCWSRVTSNYAVAPALYDIHSQRLITFDRKNKTERVDFFGYTKGDTALMLVRNAEDYTIEEAILVHIK